MDQYGVKVSSTFDTMIGKSADFNTSLIQQIKALETISNMKVTLQYEQAMDKVALQVVTIHILMLRMVFTIHLIVIKNSTSAGNETPGTR